jgi:hypothetical protein
MSLVLDLLRRAVPSLFSRSSGACRLELPRQQLAVGQQLTSAQLSFALAIIDLEILQATFEQPAPS